MKILYVCDFDLTRSAGKDRATRQKLEALRVLCSDLKVLSFSGVNRLLRFCLLPYVELASIYYLITIRPNVVISRGSVGFIFQRVAGWLKIKTVREVHADILGELRLTDHRGASKIAYNLAASLSYRSDKFSDIRIFNHPDLMRWYHESVYFDEKDFYSYNGFDPDAASTMTRSQARKKYGLHEDVFYLVFVGAASNWHGVHYLVDLQKYFNRLSSATIQIICAGGDMSPYDPERICLNFTPMTDSDCADIIKAADLCLLPVNRNRVSPGSPLKLYDYIVNKRYVVSQADTNGYSDEVESMQIGFSVDFSDPSSAGKMITDNLDLWRAKPESDYPCCEVSWTARMKTWLDRLL